MYNCGMSKFPSFSEVQQMRGRLSGARRREDTALRDEEISTRVANGDSRAAVARDVGLHPAQVGRIVKRDSKFLTREQDQRNGLHDAVRAFVGSGASYREAARRFGISKSIVHNIVRGK